MLAHWVPIVAVNEEGQPYAALVPRETSGVNIINDWSGFGQRTTASGTVELNQVPVREEYLIPIYQAFERPTQQVQFHNLFKLLLMLVLHVAQLKKQFTMSKIIVVHGSIQVWKKRVMIPIRLQTLVI